MPLLTLFIFLFILVLQLEPIIISRLALGFLRLFSPTILIISAMHAS